MQERGCEGKTTVVGITPSGGWSTGVGINGGTNFKRIHDPNERFVEPGSPGLPIEPYPSVRGRLLEV